MKQVPCCKGLGLRLSQSLLLLPFTSLECELLLASDHSILRYLQSAHLRSYSRSQLGKNPLLAQDLCKADSNMTLEILQVGLPRWCSGKESTCQCRKCKTCAFNPWDGKIPWRRKQQPTHVFLPGIFHGQRSLVGYSPCVCKEPDTTERLSTHTCKRFIELGAHERKRKGTQKKQGLSDHSTGLTLVKERGKERGLDQQSLRLQDSSENVSAKSIGSFQAKAAHQRGVLCLTGSV